MCSKLLTFAFGLAFCLIEVNSHGMMMEPPNRSSLWRFDPTAPPNYEDNQNYCGGAGVQHATNGGKCGVCGDNYADAHPQANENTGKYGQGKVVRSYKKGSVIPVEILLTANHLGDFHYSICVLGNAHAPESGEECFTPLMLSDGRTQQDIIKDQFEISNSLQLPSDLTCERCVLRWHYRTGNTWGNCDDGTQAQGCGPQETFRSCADISITN